MGSCAAPSAKGDDKFITTDYLQQCRLELERRVACNGSRLALVRDEARQCVKSVPARYNLTQFFDQAELEKHDKVTGLRPDVMLYDTTGERRCYVEICVTHPCSQDKIEAGIPILEFKVQSASDIQMLLTGAYSIKEKILRVFNWLPPFQSVDTCSGVCSVGNVDMSVWSLSGSGRLNEQTMPLAEVDLTINSDVNTWPRSLGAAELADNLRAFIRHADPHSLFPNCIMCEQAGRWEDGYLQCHSKAKIVPYTEARQCANYKVKA